ncbi:MAG: GNAT family N-acetyltransferase [Thermoplasmatota archaeon]
MEKKDWELREYKEGDEHQIINLFEEVWGEPMGVSDSLEFWNWQFKKNPFGNIYSVLGVDNDNIVGQYTVVPVPMIADGKKFTGSLSLHTIVHPDYQGQRMFTTMADELYRNLQQNGIHLTYGFPNENSIHAFKKYLKWKEILEIPLMARPINFKKSASKMFGEGMKSKFIGTFSKKYYGLRFSPIEIPSSIDIQRINTFSEEFDILWNRIKNQFEMGIVRNSKYLNWRFAEKPGYNYRIFSLNNNSKLAGYAVMRNFEYEDLNIMLIMDLVVKNKKKDYVKYLLSRCINEAENRNTDILASIVCDLEKSYKELGFRKIGFEKLPQKKYFGVRKNTSKFRDNVIFNGDKWYINWMDDPGY